MSSTGPISRRRFIAVIAGTTGAAAAAGLGGWRLLAGRDGSLPTTASFAATPGMEVVEVQPGFVDATVWNDEPLTLRANPTGTGIMLRKETIGTDHPVDAPQDFTARCVGVIDDTIIVGGHQAVETGSMQFDLGSDYEELLARAGHEAARLVSQPYRAVGVPHIHRFVERFPSTVLTADMSAWRREMFGLEEGAGGSVGAIMESASMLALERYSIAEVPDSIFEVATSTLDNLLRATGETDVQLPVDHGFVWGSASIRGRGLLLIGDRFGTSGYFADGRVAFHIDNTRSLLGVSGDSDLLTVLSATPDGQRRMDRFRSGSLITSQQEDLEAPVLHSIAPDVIISSFNAKEVQLQNATPYAVSPEIA